MKVKLLKKARKKVILIDKITWEPATERSDQILVIKTVGYKMLICTPLKCGRNYYRRYGNALNRRNREILEVARILNTNKWYHGFS